MNSINLRWRNVKTSSIKQSEWYRKTIEYIDRKSEYSFNVISAFGKTFKLKKPLIAKLSKVHNYYFLDNDYLNIHCAALSDSEVKKELFEMFVSDYEEYIECDETELSQSGIEYRKKLAEYI